MSLTHELGLKKPIASLSHEALLNIYFTSSQIKKRASGFFRDFNLTDVQFNVLMLLHHQGGDQGLSQAQISDMMLVNRANVTSLIDRMEKADLVVRTAVPEDRRTNIIKLTAKGVKVMAEAEPHYANLVKTTMSPLTETEQKQIVAMLERVRENI